MNQNGWVAPGAALPHLPSTLQKIKTSLPLQMEAAKNPQKELIALGVAATVQIKELLDI